MLTGMVDILFLKNVITVWRVYQPQADVVARFQRDGYGRLYFANFSRRFHPREKLQ